MPRARRSSGVSCLTWTSVDSVPTTSIVVLAGMAGCTKFPLTSRRRMLSSVYVPCWCSGGSVNARPGWVRMVIGASVPGPMRSAAATIVVGGADLALDAEDVGVDALRARLDEQGVARRKVAVDAHDGVAHRQRAAFGLVGNRLLARQAVRVGGVAAHGDAQHFVMLFAPRVRIRRPDERLGRVARQRVRTVEADFDLRRAVVDLEGVDGAAARRAFDA